MASPPPPTPGAVCCMCGDHGLPGELFRCRCCRARLQHRYCSDLYPRAAAYRRCNWCLRVPVPAAAQGARADGKPEEKRKTAAAASASDEEGERLQRHYAGRSPRRSSSSSPAELGHPVKKKHRAEDEEAAGAGEEIVVADASGGSEEVMRAGKARVNRARVRRYKLLTEVISC